MMLALQRLLWAGTLLVLAFASPASADPALILHRGIPTDIWLTWPEDDRLRDDKFLAVFPEWRQRYGPAQYEAARKAGFDFVRLTVDPAAFLTAPSAAKTIRLIAGVMQTVGEIRAAGLNVIVDLHAIPKGTRSVGSESYVASDVAFADYVRLVESFAIAMQGEDPAHVGFEPLNEPVLDCDFGSRAKPRWPAMALRLHGAFRAHNAKLTLIMSGACWGSADGLARLDPRPFADDNIIWSFHSYEPFLLTHQGASWSEGPTQYVDGLRYPPRAKDKAAILQRALKRIRAAQLPAATKRQLVKDTRHDIAQYHVPGKATAMLKAPFRTATAWAAKHKIPPRQLLLGEFGAIHQDSLAAMPTESRAAIMRDIRTLAERNGMAWSTWSWGGSFRITEDEERMHFSPELLDALGLDK